MESPFGIVVLRLTRRLFLKKIDPLNNEKILGSIPRMGTTAHISIFFFCTFVSYLFSFLFVCSLIYFPASFVFLSSLARLRKIE